MRVREIDILIVPGHGGAGPDHWLSRWERSLSTARRVAPPDGTGQLPDWIDRIVAAVEASTRPAVIVAHDTGVLATVAAAPRLSGRLAGAFLVAPPDPEAASHQDTPVFSDLPASRLPFATKLIGSSTDQLCSVERAQALGAAWGADVSIIAGAGHIDAASGHGPWPEGLLTFGLFLKRLGSLN
jgi:predicted alpha/beta hydrolase family esterase